MDPIVAASFAESTSPRKMANYSHLVKLGTTKDALDTDEKSCLRFFDPETDYKVRKIVSKVNDSLHIIANEPSLGLYRMQEHIHRTVPGLLEKKRELDNVGNKIEGISYDLDYSISAVDSIGQIRQFTNISEALKSAIELKKKLNEREKKEKEEQEKNAKVAKEANKSISQNEIAEGYICPICYFAHENQTALIAHWQTEHNLESYENEVFRDIVLAKDTQSEYQGRSVEKIDNKQLGRHSECEEASEEMLPAAEM